MTEAELRSARARARHSAMHTLIARHQDEFDELHRQERALLGLEPETDASSVGALRQRIHALTLELDALKRRSND